VHEHRLRDGDLIAVGQHQLRFVSSAGERELDDAALGRDVDEDTLVSPKPSIGKRA
jgi:hypothetical protein